MCGKIACACTCMCYLKCICMCGYSTTSTTWTTHVSHACDTHLPFKLMVICTAFTYLFSLLHMFRPHSDFRTCYHCSLHAFTFRYDSTWKFLFKPCMCRSVSSAYLVSSNYFWADISVCVCACVCVCVREWMCVCLHVCMSVFMHTHVCGGY